MGASKSANHKRMSRQRRIRGPASRSRSLTPLLSIKQPSNPTISSHKTSTPTSKKASAHRYRKSRLSDAAREKRNQLADIAAATKRIVIGDGNLSGSISVSPVSTIDIGAQIELSKQATEVFPHYSEPLSKWRLDSAIFPPSPIPDTTFNFTSSSVMDTVARLAPDNSPHASTSRLGAISAACPTRPAGSWLSGAVDTETQLARGTSLAANLQSDQASSFYTSHRRNTDHSGLRTHAMIYTPNLLVLRPSADSDVLLPQPKKIDVLSVAAVHAKTVHSRFDDIPSEEAHIVKDGLHSTTLERLGRALRVLADRGVRHLVLPAFGCEAGQGGDVADVAAIYAELLVCGDARGPARFKGVFESVTFCTEQRVSKMFRRAWENRVFEDELERALSEEEETMS